MPLFGGSPGTFLPTEAMCVHWHTTQQVIPLDSSPAVSLYACVWSPGYGTSCFLSFLCILLLCFQTVSDEACRSLIVGKQSDLI